MEDIKNKNAEEYEPEAGSCCCHDHEHGHHHEHEHHHDHDHDHEHHHDHGCGCGCHHHHHEHGERKISDKVTIGGGAVMTGIALLTLAVGLKMPATIIFVIAYIIVGGEILLNAAKGIAHGELLDENFLMAVASIGAMALGEYTEAIAVMLLFRIGEVFEEYAEGKSVKSITEIMDIRPDYANLYMTKAEYSEYLEALEAAKQAEDGGTLGPDETEEPAPLPQITEAAKTSQDHANPAEIKVGDIIQIKPGEKVPLDGHIIDGSSSVQTAALTGESVPRDLTIGDEILSGCVNITGTLLVQVDKEFCESTASKIIDLVQNAVEKKSKPEKFITKFARIYTPLVCLAALLLAVIPPLAMGGKWGVWIYRALVFLVISCPCALVISVPLSFFGGIGAASKDGILVKGSNYLEAIAKADTVVFDKTGTITTGDFVVKEVIPCREGGEKAYITDEVLELAAYAEGYSSHPIANSIKKAYGEALEKYKEDSLVDLRGIIGEESGDLYGALIRDCEDLPGYGVRTTLGKSDALIGDYPGLADAKLRVAVGNLKLMKTLGEDVYEKALDATKESGASATTVYVAVDGEYAGLIVIGDELKPDVPQTVEGLRFAGVTTVAMLTGDRHEAAEEIAAQAGIPRKNVFAEKLPQEKLEKLEELIKKSGRRRGTVVYVGDGVNDAPVLARADVGIAMGGLGSDAAIEAADAVIMQDEPSKIVRLIKIARKTLRIAKENIAFALIVKFGVLALGAIGIATMWAAVFADVGVMILAVLNAMRALANKI